MAKVINTVVGIVATMTIVVASLDMSGWIKLACLITTVAGILIASEIEWKEEKR